MHRAPESHSQWSLVFYPPPTLVFLPKAVTRLERPNAQHGVNGCPGKQGVIHVRWFFSSSRWNHFRRVHSASAFPTADPGLTCLVERRLERDRKNGDVPGGLRQKHPASLLRHWRSSSVDDDNIDRLSQFSGLLFLGELMSERKSGPAQCGRRKGCARR